MSYHKLLFSTLVKNLRTSKRAKFDPFLGPLFSQLDDTSDCEVNYQQSILIQSKIGIADLRFLPKVSLRFILFVKKPLKFSAITPSEHFILLKRRKCMELSFSEKSVICFASDLFFLFNVISGQKVKSEIVYCQFFLPFSAVYV